MDLHEDINYRIILNDSMNIRIETKYNPRILVDIDQFELNQNRITFLFGESGIGKSIIARAIYGLLDDEILNIKINTHSYKKYLQQDFVKQIQKNGFFVFQEPSSHLNPMLHLSKQLNEGDLISAANEKEILNRLWRSYSHKTVDSLLNIYPKPHRPSGGEKQRILLTMAFKKLELFCREKNSTDPNLFIFDEPTGSLDNVHRNMFLDLLFEKYVQKPFTCLIITHDYSMISEIMLRHKHLSEKIMFKELSLQNKNLQLNDFAPQIYTNWINRTSSTRTSDKTKGKLICNLKGGLEIFNRRLFFSSDSGNKNICPLQVYENQIVYLKAGSGVGKTTIAKIIMGLLKCNKLHLKFNGFKLDDNSDRNEWRKNVWAKKAGMVFQHADEALNLNSKVSDVFKGLPLNENVTAEMIKSNLQIVFEDEITDEFLNQKVASLSGGQKQRLNLLRTLLLDTQLIILDEPLNGLDFVSMQKILSIILKKKSENKGVLLVSHNEDIFDKVIDHENILYLFFENI